MTFEWRTDIGDAAEPARAPREPRRPRSGWRYLLPAVLLGLLALLAATLATEQADALGQQAGEQVIASHRLLERAALNRDAELYRLGLSGRSAAWTSDQLAAVRQGALYDLPALGLRWTGEPASIVDVEVAPDLDSAILTVERRYASRTPAGITITIAMLQTATYRLGSERWLLAPPPTGTGGWDLRAGPRLEVAFDRGDEAWATRLHEDLEADLERLCAALGSCEPGRLLTIRLDPDAGTTQTRAGASLTLPATTAIGLPRDEAAYEALRRGYLRAVLSLARLSNGERRPLFQEALAGPLAAAIGQAAVALPPDAYRQALREGTTLRELYASLAPYWHGSAAGEPVMRVRAALFLDYLRGQGADLVALRAALGGAPTLGDWAGALLEGVSFASSIESAELAFLRHLAEGADLSANPGPPPRQQLMALCRSTPRSIRGRLFLYDPVLDRLTDTGDAGFASLITLPDGDGVLLHPSEWFREDGSGRSRASKSLVWWRDGVLTTIMDTPLSTGIAVFGIAPDGDTVALHETVLDGSRAGRTLLLDLNACATGTCTPRTLPAAREIVWSPEGDAFLLLATDGHLFLGDGDVLTELATAVQSAAWAGANRIVALPDAGTPFVFALGPAGSPATGSVAAVTLPAGTAEASADLRLLGATATDPERLLVAVRSEPDQPIRTRFFWWDLDRGAAEPWLTADQALFRPALYHFAPDGSAASVTMWRLDRPFRVTLSAFDEPYGELVWRDMASGRQRSYLVRNWFIPGTATWDADGTWLAIARERAILLAAPGEDALRVVLLDQARCRRVAWLDN